MRASRAVRPAVGFVTAVGLWWGAVVIFEIRPFFLPGPHDIADAFARHGPHLLEQTWVTLGHTVAGFAIATVAGVATALLLAASAPVRETILPLLVAVQAVPKVAIAPLLIVWLGFGPGSKIALVSLLCFFPILVSAMAGLATTPADLVDLARSWSGSRWRTYVKIRIPHALPQMFTGLKVAGSLALIGAVVAQLTTPNAGLGAVIVRSGQSADTPLAFAAVVLLAAIGISLFYTLAALERLLLPWARATTG